MSSLHLQNINLAIFDFDGTIADTSEGIVDAHLFTLNHMGCQIPSVSDLKKLIGRNLLDVYIQTFGFDLQSAKTAVEIYRNRYKNEGIHLASVYPGFQDLLKELSARQIKLGVATLKSELFAKTMLEEMKLDKYFEHICGMDANDHLHKSQILTRCMILCTCTGEQTVLVGDTDTDLQGAQEAGINFIGVTYGFGKFSNQYSNLILAHTPNEIAQILI